MSWIRRSEQADTFFREHNFQNVKIIENKRQTNFGSLNQIKAYKIAYDNSSGDVLFFLDSDDYFSEFKLEKVIENFSNNPDKKILFDYPSIINNEKIINYWNITCSK